MQSVETRVKLNGGAKTAAKFGIAVRAPRVRGNGFRHSSCVKKVSFERKGNSFLFHNGAHPLRATRHARVSDYSEDRAYQEEVVRTTHPLLVSLSLSYAHVHMTPRWRRECVLCTDARAVESLSLHLANPHPVYSARNNALDVALPSGRGKHRESLCSARLVPPRFRLTRQQPERSISSEKNDPFRQRFFSRAAITLACNATRISPFSIFQNIWIYNFKNSLIHLFKSIQVHDVKLGRAPRWESNREEYADGSMHFRVASTFFPGSRKSLDLARSTFLHPGIKRECRLSGARKRAFV